QSGRSGTSRDTRAPDAGRGGPAWPRPPRWLAPTLLRPALRRDAGFGSARESRAPFRRRRRCAMLAPPDAPAPNPKAGQRTGSAEARSAAARDGWHGPPVVSNRCRCARSARLQPALARPAREPRFRRAREPCLGRLRAARRCLLPRWVARALLLPPAPGQPGAPHPRSRLRSQCLRTRLPATAPDAIAEGRAAQSDFPPRSAPDASSSATLEVAPRR